MVVPPTSTGVLPAAREHLGPDVDAFAPPHAEVPVPAPDEPARPPQPELVALVANETARPRRTVPRWVRRLAGMLVLPAVWQLVLTLDIVSERQLASPATVVGTARQLVASGVLAEHLWASLQRVTIGLSIGITAGVVLALLAGLFRLGEDLIDPPMQMLRTIPVLAIVPLFIIWLGIDEAPKIAMIAVATAFPMYVNVLAGIRGVDGRLIEAARILGLRRGRLALHIVLPGSIPSALVGLRYSLGVAWLVLVFAETLNTKAGIGVLISRAREFMQTDVILVGACIYAVLGFLTDLFVRLLQRVLLSWRTGFEGT